MITIDIIIIIIIVVVVVVVIISFYSELIQNQICM